MLTQPFRHLPAFVGGLLTAMVLTAGGTQSLHAQAAPALFPGGLAQVGPIDPISGYPLWYQDTNGVSLGLCEDPANCFWALPDPALPKHFPTSATDPFNWPEELFYYAADALMLGFGGERARLVIALEGAFFDGPVVIGDQVVFSRLRIRLSGMTPLTKYVITHPYGKVSVISDAFGDVFTTRDIGLSAPGDFVRVLAGGLGPFLIPTGFNTFTPGAFLTTGLGDTTVTGAPFSTGGAAANYFQIDGPGVGNAFVPQSTGLNTARQTLFTVQGVIASQLGAQIDKANCNVSATSTSVDVWASSAAGQTITASIDGSIEVGITEDVASPGKYFTRIELGAGAPRPLALVVTNASDAPTTTVSLSPIPDAVHIRTAVFTIGGDLAITASSTDQTAANVLQASLDSGLSALLPGAGLGEVAGNLGLPAGAVAPETVTVTSSGGGSATYPVEVLGTGTSLGGGTAVIANAGPDQTVLSGTTVVLDGSMSLGPVVSYAWAHDAGALINLIASNTPQPQFIAPAGLPGGVLDITFTLTVFNNQQAFSTDLVVVHVSDPVGPAPDKITITAARYEINKETWRVDGTAAVLANQTVNVYLGDNLGPNLLRFVGSGVVDAVGLWRFRGANGSALANNSVPQAGETLIWGISTLPGTPGPFAYQAK